MPEAPVVEPVAERLPIMPPTALAGIRLAEMLRRRKLEAWMMGCILVMCLLYCALTPRQFESRAVLAYRTSPATALRMEGTEQEVSTSFASGQVHLETLAGELRSDGLAWSVILSKKLYRAPAFMGRFAVKYPDFRPEAVNPDAQAYLLERFKDRLRVRTIPHTLLLEVRFRSGDAGLSRDVVEQLLQSYGEQSATERVSATEKASGWLREQIAELKARVESADQHVAEFKKVNQLLEPAGTTGDGRQGNLAQGAAILQADVLNRELVAATADRILREAEFRATERGDPELVLASDARLQGDGAAAGSAVLRQIHARQDELEVELAQLSAEHGPNFPRVVEIHKQLDELNRQLAAQHSQLRERFHNAWQTAAERERMLRQALDARTGEGITMSAKAVQLATMQREAEATRGVYLRLKEKVDEASVAAGIATPVFTVVDTPRQAACASWPNWPLSIAIALFGGFWVAVCAGYAADKLRLRAVALLIALSFALPITGRPQAPTPSTSGLPTGVARIPQSQDNRATPTLPEPPGGLGGAGAIAARAGDRGNGSMPASLASIPGPIGAGDVLEVSEAQTPEFHTVARVTAQGLIALPMVGELKLAGMDEGAAARAIAAALVERGMLLHPQVFVVVTASGAQDVSVLGEVARPGVYGYGLHHRLLDVISAASGLSATAGSLVYITHRNEREPALAVALDSTGGGNTDEHNPELMPGDVVQVMRAGLVYVVGDVIRPGGFLLEGAHPMTVLQALSLAWGPSQNAALKKALLIREQKGGRTVTALNLKRMLRGQDPDFAVMERDIVFVPDSTAKNLLNRTMESVVQSAAGVSIYAGMVYSQRF